MENEQVPQDVDQLHDFRDSVTMAQQESREDE